MKIHSNRTRSVLVIAVLATVVALSSADSAGAQFVTHRVVGHSYYHRPIPIYQGPTSMRYSPSTSSFYSVPLVTQPVFSGPVVYSQRYSFYSGPRYAYYPMTFQSYEPAFRATNTYYPVDPLSPYVSGFGTVPQSTSPYKTNLYFRY